MTRLGFAVMLKFYEIEDRFPAYPEEVPPAAVRYLGSLVKVDPALFAEYPWAGRSIKYHRSQICKVYGTRPPTEDDEDRWAQWLAEEMCPTETNRDRLAAALRRRCRSEKVEPPTTGQLERVVASGCRQFDDAFAATTAGRLGPMVCGRLEELLSRPNVLAEPKSDPGPLGLDTLLAEIGKLSTVRALGLDEAVFGGASDRIVAAWRARAAEESSRPSGAARQGASSLHRRAARERLVVQVWIRAIRPWRLRALPPEDGGKTREDVRFVSPITPRSARDGPAQVEQGNGFSPADDGEEDSAIKHMRTLGAWSARAIFFIEVVYVAVFVAGFASNGNTSAPLPDPYLAIGEIIILVMAPIMVCLMLAIHQCAPKQAKPFTLVALGWMLAAAAFTIVVHFVGLTVARHIDPATFPGYARIFGWQWPSTFYAIDIVAWDVFFGLSLLFAVPAFAHSRDATLVRRGLILSGSLCLIGLIGPFANAIGWRTIGILGYTVVFGLTCLPLSQTFKAGTSRADPAQPDRNCNDIPIVSGK